MNDEVTLWINSLKTGDDEAAQLIWQRYFDKLVHLARRRLGTMPRRSADEEDVALSAFDSFCRAARDGRCPKLNDRSDLWKLLITITIRKANAQLASRPSCVKMAVKILGSLTPWGMHPRRSLLQLLSRNSRSYSANSTTNR